MFRTAFLMIVLLTLVTGVLYPLAMTGLAHLVFPAQSHGSLLIQGGRITGSKLIGRQFEDPKYFWSRPSATAPFPYNPASSSGSNYGPLSPDLKKAMAARREALRNADPGNTAPIPVDLLTASGSGLDPHISPEAAEYQAGRVARVRRLAAGVVRGLIAAHTAGRQLGFLGEPVVNVVELNRALDEKAAADSHR
jgi:potassium-transporting ATPase KdpC subunit